MVTQHIEIEDGEDEGTHLCSYDTYYLRTPERDKAYEKEYGMQMNVDGRRIRATKIPAPLSMEFRQPLRLEIYRRMGAEHSPEKHRLHFHGIFYIPDGTMPKMIIETEDYSFKTKRRQKAMQNMYFTERFGRNDFEPLDEYIKNDALAYIIKYIEKTGERIVYSKGLPQFFISDIMDDDIVCPIGLEDKKLLLFDNFVCWDEGEYIGEVSADVIKRMRKCN